MGGTDLFFCILPYHIPSPSQALGLIEQAVHPQVELLRLQGRIGYAQGSQAAADPMGSTCM